MKDVYLQLYSLYGEIDRDIGAPAQQKRQAMPVWNSPNPIMAHDAAGIGRRFKRGGVAAFFHPYPAGGTCWDLPLAQVLGMPYIVIAGAIAAT